MPNGTDPQNFVMRHRLLRYEGFAHRVDAASANDARERPAQALAQAQNISIEEARTRDNGY